MHMHFEGITKMQSPLATRKAWLVRSRPRGITLESEIL